MSRCNRHDSKDMACLFQEASQRLRTVEAALYSIGPIGISQESESFYISYVR